jgi:hypothetical protein
MRSLIGIPRELFDDHTRMWWFRQRPDRSWHCLTRLTVGQFNFQRMCQQYGPGQYMIQVTLPGGWVRQTYLITRDRATRRPRWTVRWGTWWRQGNGSQTLTIG